MSSCCNAFLFTTDFDDGFLTAPKHRLSPSSSLDAATSLFLPEISFEGSAEATSSFSSDDACSRLEQLTGLEDFPLGDLQQTQQIPVPAPLPLGPSGLRLQLDFGSVATAWRGISGGAHPFQLTSTQLSEAAAAIPSTADLEASLRASAQPSHGVPAPAASAQAPAEEAQLAKEAAAVAATRARDAQRRAAQRKSSDRRPSFPPRKLSGDKRPRIKGRFVTKAEYEVLLAAAHAQGAELEEESQEESDQVELELEQEREEDDLMMLMMDRVVPSAMMICA